MVCLPIQLVKNQLKLLWQNTLFVHWLPFNLLEVLEKQQKPQVLQPHFGAKCEKATHTPKSGKMESFGTRENSEDNLRGQISLPQCVLYINENLLKCRCPKWPRISHLDICSPSYGQKKGRKSNCQFDSRPLKVKNRPLSDVASSSAARPWKTLDESYNFGLKLVSIRVWGEEL